MDLRDYVNPILTYRNLAGYGPYNGTPLSCFGIPPACPSLSPNEEIALIGKLRDKVYQGSWNVLVTSGEIKESAEQILDVSKRLAGFVVNAKKGRFSRAIKSLGVRQRRGTRLPRAAEKNAASFFLEYQFGILPLLGDLDNAMEFLANQVSKPKPLKVKVRHRRRTDLPSTAWSWDGYNELRAQIIAIYDVLPDARVAAGFTARDVPSVLYELTPFSWLADWFIPIGDYLSALAFTSQAQNVRFVKTTVQTTKCTGISNGSYYIIDCPDLFYYTSVSMRREVLTSLSVPLPTAKVSNPLDAFDLRKSALLASILSQHRG
jgi:hypothetical protein